MVLRGVRSLFLTGLVLLVSAPVAGAQATATGTGGAAATVDALGTRAAIEALDDGGNAVDAAVAAAAVLGVTEPFSCGIGGGGFMVIRTADGELTTIDGRETAPAAMTPDSFFEDGAPLIFAEARYSGLSAGVPGTVRTWSKALIRHGTWSLRRALQAGVRVAREGFAIDATFASQIEDNVAYFDDVPSTAALYLDPDGTPLDAGATLRNPDLARAYERIGRHGSRGFYEGPIARAIAEAAQRPPVAQDADHVWRPGLLTERDVRGYRARLRPPTVSSFAGLDIVGMGPPSSGGSTVGEILNILDGFELAGADRTRALHLFLEASRLSFADRAAYVADPAYFDVPLAGLLSPSFAAERRALIDPARAASGEVAAGDPYDDQGSAARAAVATTPSPGHPRQSTTHLVVSDDDGTVVSYTFTIESTGGNGVVVPGWGFLLNNELTDFAIDSLTAPNRAEGGKRPRSSMSPVIVLRDGEPLLAVGSPGGSMIITTVAQVLLDRLGLGTPLPDAIAAPRAAQRNGPRTTAEPAFIASPEGQALAGTYGHAFTPQDDAIGAVTALEFLPDARTLAAAEPERRGGGTAAVERPGG
jgi:gamma-glutamyltranspeptidase / glutathione hydrolase